ncbi:aminoacyl-tRNA deacylase [Thiobacillus denitrificans]|uniref:Prolyl-tRNA synthetase n=1 Tax=Thiobacillus denitrificans TaxID=36861 RepID=A0A106BJ30_THIDE|nr:YbaK/EbsC family protein [Thiobacillus denitrificans]KVW93282.1 prolyl-tRNA synthetase [Thiobacillus denitrificans]
MNALHRMERFLDQHMIPFDLVAHPHSQTSAETARAAGVTLDRVAKGVLLDGMDCQMVAMIPADQEVQLGKLRQDVGVEFSLADEASVSRLFPECEPGVVPGLPNAWGVEMVWDDALMAQPDVYLEAGDHERLLHIETRYLREAFGDAPSCHFSQPRMAHVA